RGESCRGGSGGRARARAAAPPARGAGTAQDRRTNQNANPKRDANGKQRPLLGFAGDARQRLIAQPPSLITGGLTASAETIHHFAQDRGNGVANLVARFSRNVGRLPPGDAANSFQFFLDSAQMLLDSGDAGAEIR